MRETYSIRDIAEKAGVSIATVSRYFNHPETVSPSTGKIIQNAIQEFGYVPNMLAHGVFHNGIKAIGLLVPSVADSYFNYMTKLIEANASKLGYAIILCDTDDRYEQEVKNIQLLQSLRTSGIIAVRPRYTELYKNLICPVVSYETPISPDTLNVTTNDFEAGRQAFWHLYERGSRNLLMITGPKHMLGSENRCRGFFDAAKETDCSVRVCEIPTDYHFYMGGNFLDPYLSDTQTDGIFAFSDMIAAVALYWLQTHDLRVPEDVRLVGFDDSAICSLIRPNLTTFKQPGDLICQTLVDSLVSIIQGKPPAEKEIVLDSELIVRGST